MLLTLPAGGLPQAQLRAGIAGVKRGTGEYIYYKLLLLFANSSFDPCFAVNKRCGTVLLAFLGGTNVVGHVVFSGK